MTKRGAESEPAGLFEERNRPQPCGGIARRSFLKSCATLGAALGFLPFAKPLLASSAAPETQGRRKKQVAVIGAGAFGGWSALHLLRRGASVKLLDAWGPGNSRASSGGETRIIRATYGPDRTYVRMVVRALQLWQEAEKRWNRKLLYRTGALWMAGTQDEYEKASLPLLEEADVAFETLTPAEAAKCYPQINFEGVEWALYERDAGYLLARQACQAVLEGFMEEGGEYRQVSVTPGPIAGGEMRGLKLSDGTELVADHYVFACGPWLGKLFPELLGDLIKPTRQEVFFFGPPAGDARFLENSLPVWIDNGERLFYGIPANQWRGFKLADDTRGPLFDPTAGDRVPTPQALQAARDYLKLRFPALKDAPLLEARVCQYENTPDHHFIVDRHPHAANVWLVGGGSGHGFKHGPALGELISQVVLEQEPAPAFFSLARF